MLNDRGDSLAQGCHHGPFGIMTLVRGRPVRVIGCGDEPFPDQLFPAPSGPG